MNMAIEEPLLDEVVFKKIKSGNGSFDSILSIKKEYNISILKIMGTIQRLEENNIITRSNNKYVINK
jgi:predicted transcriptional regulator